MDKPVGKPSAGREIHVTGEALYDRIGEGYDLTRRADPGLLDQLVGHLTPEPASSVLDLACGTGNYALALAARGLRVTAADLSETMLAALLRKIGARKNGGGGNGPRKAGAVACCRADAAHLPFAAAAFDGVLCVQALHHFADLSAVLREAHRVMLRGRLVIFTALEGQVRGYWLNDYFPKTLEQASSQLPTRKRLEAALGGSGLALRSIEPWEVPRDLRDLFLYCGKHRPALYLDRRVRAGISSFAKAKEPKELVHGLKRLSSDIASGRIEQVMAGYRHAAGDYVIVVAEKT